MAFWLVCQTLHQRRVRHPQWLNSLATLRPAPPAVVSSQPVNAAALPETPAPANAATTPNPFNVAPADVQQAQIASAQPQAAAPTNAAENAAAATPDTSAPADTDANSSAQANTEPPPASASHSTAQSKKKSVASTAKRAHTSRSSAAYSPRGRRGSVRSHVMGITSDGRLILRLPSGRTAIVAPDDKKPCLVIGTGVISTATRRLVLRPDLGRIISRTIETGGAALFPCVSKPVTWVTDEPPTIFIEKKSLPWFVISGIPRARAGTTNLLALATAFVSVTFSAGARAQGLAPSTLGGDGPVMRSKTTWSR